MEKWRMTMIALGIAAILSVPMFSIALAAPAADVTVIAQGHGGEILTVKLLPPLENRNVWYGGAVIPIRVLVTDENDTHVTNANVTVWVNDAPGSSPGNSFMGNTMMNIHDSVYQFNLDTKPYPAGPGSDPILIKILAKGATPDDRVGELSISISLN